MCILSAWPKAKFPKMFDGANGRAPIKDLWVAGARCLAIDLSAEGEVCCVKSAKCQAMAFRTQSLDRVLLRSLSADSPAKLLRARFLLNLWTVSHLELNLWNGRVRRQRDDRQSRLACLGQCRAEALVKASAIISVPATQRRVVLHANACFTARVSS